MWEVLKHLSHRGNSMRRLLVNAIAAFIAVLFLVLFVASNALAAGNATWSGKNLSYEGDTYEVKTANGTTPPGLKNNSDYYVYSEVTDAVNGTGESHIIYFDSGVSTSTATSANYEIFSIDSSGKYSSSPKSGPTDIPVTPKTLTPSATQAVWNGNNIDYDGKTYTGDGASPKLADGTTPAGLGSGTQYYQVSGSPAADGTGTMYVLYFAKGTNVATATTATYATYKIGSDGKVGAQTGSTKSVDIVPQAQSPPGTTTNTNGGASSCNVDGIGWIVCPVSSFLADGMDKIFELLKGFMLVEPISTKTDSPLYQAWNIMRGIANIAFVIAFLIIIYSQITGAGINNYGLKKLIPRLIVAALLVNLSYFICAIAVDLSNVVGTGTQQILVDLRTSLDSPTSKSVGSWESVTGFILADAAVTSAAAVTIGGVVLSTGASLGGALILLLPMLLGLILAVLVALVVLAARQALIIILIVVAPLAFVAYLLPNTENLFEKWRSIFMTMLVFFPLFALVFGGSQLAAFLIIQTVPDGSSNAINMILLAMFVQVAPLVLTPLLIKFSGGIIGRIAGFVNDPSKGLIDRTRNWAKEQSEYMAARNMARQDPVRNRQVFRRFALTMDQRKRAQQERLAAYKERSDARWTGTQEYSNIQQQLRAAQDSKAEGVESANARYEISKTIPGNAYNLNTRLRQTQRQIENAKELSNIQFDSNNAPRIAEERLRSKMLKDQLAAVHSTHDREYDEFKAGRVGHFPATAAVNAMLNQARLDTRLLSMNALASESAKRAINEQFTADIKQNTQRLEGQLLQTYAGGVQGVVGAQRALASAISAQDDASATARKNALTILDDANYGDGTVTQIALGNTAGTSVVITQDMMMAATAKIGGGGNKVAILDLLREFEINPTEANQGMRQILTDALAGNSNRPQFLGMGMIAAMKQGIAPPTGKVRFDQWVAETINADKLGSAEVLVNMDRDYLGVVRDTLVNNLSTVPISPRAKRVMKDEIDKARSNPLFSGKIAERREVLDEIYRRL